MNTQNIINEVKYMHNELLDLQQLLVSGNNIPYEITNHPLRALFAEVDWSRYVNVTLAEVDRLPPELAHLALTDFYYRWDQWNIQFPEKAAIVQKIIDECRWIRYSYITDRHTYSATINDLLNNKHKLELHAIIPVDIWHTRGAGCRRLLRTILPTGNDSIEMDMKARVISDGIEIRLFLKGYLDIPIYLNRENSELHISSSYLEDRIQTHRAQHPHTN